MVVLQKYMAQKNDIHILAFVKHYVTQVFHSAFKEAERYLR